MDKDELEKRVGEVMADFRRKVASLPMSDEVKENLISEIEQSVRDEMAKGNTDGISISIKLDHDTGELTIEKTGLSMSEHGAKLKTVVGMQSAIDAGRELAESFSAMIKYRGNVFFATNPDLYGVFISSMCWTMLNAAVSRMEPDKFMPTRIKTIDSPVVHQMLYGMAAMNASGMSRQVEKAITGVNEKDMEGFRDLVEHPTMGTKHPAFFTKEILMMVDDCEDEVSIARKLDGEGLVAQLAEFRCILKNLAALGKDPDDYLDMERISDENKEKVRGLSEQTYFTERVDRLIGMTKVLMDEIAIPEEEMEKLAKFLPDGLNITGALSQGLSHISHAKDARRQDNIDASGIERALGEKGLRDMFEGLGEDDEDDDEGVSM